MQDGVGYFSKLSFMFMQCMQDGVGYFGKLSFMYCNGCKMVWGTLANYHLCYAMDARWCGVHWLSVYEKQCIQDGVEYFGKLAFMLCNVGKMEWNTLAN